jgi:hypothetical protein
MFLTDYNETFLTALNSSTINSDYINTYSSEYDYSLIDDVTTVQTISGETNTGESFSVDFTIQLNLIDDIQPTFDGSTFNTYVSSSVQLSLQDLEDLILVQDETDISDDIVIDLFHDTYTTNYDTPGLYQVTFSAEDTSGNIAFHDINLVVVDMTPPLYTFDFDDFEFVVVSNNQPITEENLSAVLSTYGIVLSEQDFTYSIIYDTYFGHESDVGLYTMQLQIDYEDETTEIIDLEIQVVANELSNDTSPENNLFKILGISAFSLSIVVVVVIFTRKKK